MRAYIFNKLLSVDGRIGRLAYIWRFLVAALFMIVASVGLLVCYFALDVVLAILRIHTLGPAVPFAGVMILFALMCWAQIALTVRRYHDFGWSGKWVLAGFGLSLLSLLSSAWYAWRAGGWAEIIAQLTLAHGHVSYPVASADPIRLLAMAANLALTLQLLFRPGDEGDNRFDEGGSHEPAPQAPPQADRVAPTPSPPKPATASFPSEPRAVFGRRR